MQSIKAEGGRKSWLQMQKKNTLWRCNVLSLHVFTYQRLQTNPKKKDTSWWECITFWNSEGLDRVFWFDLGNERNETRRMRFPGLEGVIPVQHQIVYFMYLKMNKDEQHLTVPRQTSANTFWITRLFGLCDPSYFLCESMNPIAIAMAGRNRQSPHSCESLHHDLKGRALQTLHWFPKVLLPLLHCAKITRQMEKESWGHSTIDHLAVVELHWTHLTIPLLELPVLASLSQTSELVSPAALVSYPSVATHVLDKHISQFVWQ